MPAQCIVYVMEGMSMLSSRRFTTESGVGHRLLITRKDGSQCAVVAKPLNLVHGRGAPFSLAVHCTVDFKGAESTFDQCDALDSQPCRMVTLNRDYDAAYPHEGSWREKTKYLREVLRETTGW